MTPDDARETAYRDAAAAVDGFLERLGATDGGRDRDLRSTFARAMDLNLDLVRQSLDAAGDALSLFGAGDGTITMPPTIAGRDSTTLLWVHNHESTTRDAVVVAAGPVGPVGADHWTFDPDPVTVPPASAAPVVARLSVPADTPAGTYQGSISIGDASPIVVRLDVHDPAPVRHDTW